jgi:L-lactate dehydrogenase (cytochrome)
LGSFPLGFEGWEKKAKEKLSPEQFAYVSAGAGDGDSVEENVRSLGRWRLVPRVLKDGHDQTTSTEILGVKLASPMVIAPVRGLGYVRAKGQEATARAAAKCEVPLMLSNLASTSLEEIASILGPTPRLFQLYPCADYELLQNFLVRAEKSGYLAVALTVDTSGHPIQYNGPETAEFQNYGNEIYLSDPEFQSRLKNKTANDRKAALELIRKLRDSRFTWRDVDKIREHTRLPIFLKGILSPEDAQEAVDHHLNGLVVSNHGGRTMSGEVASIDVLPEIVDVVGSHLTVLYDGGVRSGTDVVKALALGAKAVLVGRACVYALAVGGEEGVVSLLGTMLAELKSSLATCGCSSVKELNRTFVRRFP